MSVDLSGLNPAQLEAVTAPEGPVLVIAGAGSGKTRTIVHRLAWLHDQGMRSESMLLLTFTRKAATEMLQRAAALLGQSLHGVQGGTFHGFAYSVLRHHRPAWAAGPLTVMDAADSAAAVQHCKEALKIGKGDRSFPRTQGVIALLSKSRNKEISVSELLRIESPHLLVHAEALERLAEAYTAYRREHALLDYDDLLFELEALLRDCPEPAERLRSRFEQIMVDEYQDTNRVQARLVRLLAGQRGNVMAVGDDAQSIYAFRGADVRNILDFKEFFPSARLIRLEENYRSTQPVLDVANAVLAESREAYAKHLFTTRQGGDPVRLVRPLSDLRQAELVAQRIDALLEEHPPREIAVLFRAGYQSYHLEVALSKRDIRFRKYGGLRYTEAAHIKDVLAYVRLVINGLDMPSLERVAALSKGVGPKTAHRVFEMLRTGDGKALEKIRDKHRDFAADLDLLDELRSRALPPSASLSLILDHYRPRLELLFPEDWPRRLQGLDELRHIASAYADLDQFVADLSLETPDEETTEEESVVLSTIHSAKGLEWNAVLILDLVEDRFPSRHALARPEDFEEERRLMYVACTRAREVLELYVPQSVYSRAGGTERATESPFVRELAAALYEEWQESYDGRVQLRERRAVPSAPRPVVAPAGADDGPPLSRQDPAVCGFCRHKIFGRGKIVEHIPPDKCRVNFPGLGLKVILSSFLTME